MAAVAPDSDEPLARLRLRLDGALEGREFGQARSRLECGADELLRFEQRSHKASDARRAQFAGAFSLDSAGCVSAAG